MYFCCLYPEFISSPSHIARPYVDQHLCFWVICQQRRAAEFIRDAALVRPRPADVKTGCNFKQHALTLNGRTPATKATTKRLLLTALPVFSASCVTPAPSWKNITAASLRSVGRPLERAQNSALATDRTKWIKWWEHLSVNPDETFLSGKNLRSESFQTGRGTRPRAGAASWPRSAFRISFPPIIQTPPRSKSTPDTMPFSNSPPQCGLQWSYYSPSVLWVTNRKPPQIFHECHTTFAIFLSLFESSLMQWGNFSSFFSQDRFLWISVFLWGLFLALHWLVISLRFRSMSRYVDLKYWEHMLQKIDTNMMLPVLSV